MAREFFVRDWLRRHLVVYALSHLCVMPLLVGWALAASGAEPLATAATQALLGLAFVSGLAFEMARKMRAPGDERPMADSYTRALGVRVASAMLLVVVIVAAAIGVAMAGLAAGALHPAVVATCAVATVAVAVTVSAFGMAPTSARAGRVEASVGIAMLVVHGAAIAAVAGAFGVAVR
jgi:4-hydroxybenzoate polyprenyltransferase